MTEALLIFLKSVRKIDQPHCYDRGENCKQVSVSVFLIRKYYSIIEARKRLYSPDNKNPVKNSKTACKCRYRKDRFYLILKNLNYRETVSLTWIIVKEWSGCSLDPIMRGLSPPPRVRDPTAGKPGIKTNSFNFQKFPLLFYLFGTTPVCRWFRFAQLAKGKKSRP